MMKSPFAPIEGSPHVELKPAVEPTARWVRVWFGGWVIADSRHALLLRQYGREQMPGYYFPPVVITPAVGRTVSAASAF